MNAILAFPLCILSVMAVAATLAAAGRGAFWLMDNFSELLKRWFSRGTSEFLTVIAFLATLIGIILWIALLSDGVIK